MGLRLASSRWCLLVLALAFSDSALGADGPGASRGRSENGAGTMMAAPRLRSSPSREPNPEDVSRLAAAARKLRPGVLLVGHPDLGLGTAFVISRKHRLLATAAHAADLFQEAGSMQAMLDGSVTTFKVDRVWYHPDLARELDTDLFVRSPQLRDGPVSNECPDLAVMRLAPGGPDLPAECEMAEPEELGTLFGQPVGLLGYPGLESWPGERRAKAFFLTGTITSVLQVHDMPGSPPVGFQAFEFEDRRDLGGCSGGPVFLGNGHIVGILSSPTARITPSGEPAFKHLVIRIDNLWKLLAYHSLGAQVELPQPWRSFEASRDLETGPDLDRLRRAASLVREARAALKAGRYRTAFDLCDEANRLAPHYSSPYTVRARARLEYCVWNWDLLSLGEKKDQIEWAAQELLRQTGSAPTISTKAIAESSIILGELGIINYLI